MLTIGRRGRTWSAALAIGVAACGLAVTSSPAHAASATGATVDQLTEAARLFITQRTSALVEGAAEIRALALPGTQVELAVVAAESAAAASLRDSRAFLATKGVGYTGADTKIIDRTVRRAGTSLVLRVTERTTLDYKKVRGDEPPNTMFTAHREFVFSPMDGGWRLDAQRLMDEGPVPSNEPARAGVAAADPSATRPDGSAGNTKTGPVIQAYNYPTMAEYAERYWDNYNTAYRDFTGQYGGDCTNFISQALRAGGWEFVSGWYRDYKYWWYNSQNETWSWINTNSWASFAQYRGRVRLLNYVTEMGLADILQADFGSPENGKDHSMIASYVSDQPYLTYHTTDTYRRAWWDFYNRNPNATYYAWRT